MNIRKLSKRILLLLALLALALGGFSQALNGAAMPISPVDESKVPHYFGPYPNWANSPFTVPDATVTITGDGSGATATATVGGNGVITAFTVTSPGSGYTYANVNITSATGTGASGNAVISTTGSVTSIAVDTAGSGYTSPSVVISGGGPIGVPPTITLGPSTRYSVTVGSATGGSFTLTVGTTTTAALPWNASAVSIQAALAAVGIGTNSVTGTGSLVDPWIINFSVVQSSVVVNAAGLTQPVLDAAVAAGVSPVVYTVNIGSATGGSFTLSVDAATTAPIAWNALASDVQAALAGVGVSTAVTGSGSVADPWVIYFAAAPTTVAISQTGLTMGVTDASIAPGIAPVVYDVTVGSATGGTFTLTIDGLTTASIAWNATAADVATALTNAGVVFLSVSGTGSVADPWVISFSTAPTAVSIDATALTMGVVDFSAAVGATSDVYNVTVGSATGGSFTLTVDGLTTGPIAWNAAATDVQTALANAGVSTVSVTGTGTIADPWVITFTTAPVSVTMDGTALTQGVADASAALGVPPAVYDVHVGSATGGTFLLTVDTATTAPIAWNALAADVQAALLAVGVNTTVTGSGSIADPWVITFAVAPGSFTMDSAGLTQAVTDASVALGTSPVAYDVHVGSATGGLFQLTVDGATTGFIFWNATAADVQAALAAVGVNTVVTGSGSIASPWAIYFMVAPTTVTANFAGLTQGVLDTGTTLQVTDAYLLDLGSAYGGTFTLSVDGVTTTPIAWNALPSDIQSALALISVTTSVSGVAPSFTIVFSVPPTTFTVDAAALLQPPSIGATATAYGSVEAVILDNPGAGYKYPTVDFDMPTDPNGIQAQGHVLCAEPNCQPAVPGDPVTIIGVQVDMAGSGYILAPGVTIRDGTIFQPTPGGGSGALAHSSLIITAVNLDTYGSGYTSVPTVTINDPTGTGATATATVNFGAVTAIDLVSGGTDYLTVGGIKKFQDGLPQLCIPVANFSECDAMNNNLGQHIPIAVPDTTTFPGTDYYVIALVQAREWMNSSLPASGTLVREYVQLETSNNASWSKSVALQNSLLDGTTTPTLMPDGSQAIAVDDPHWLGPIIVAQKDRAVRITFYNLLPAGEAGDLFLPVDSSFMGSGMGPNGMADPVDEGTVMDAVRNPMCSEKYYDPMMRDMCFTENRATLHLHGGISPWISDGTPHQWITPAQETTNPWPQGVAVSPVPDMSGVPGVPDCTADNDGCMTFYYTNQQSARLMFYHDHAWGITRLNVYAGEAAGYMITDPTEQALVNNGIIPADQIPLVIQDRTFVPDAAQMAAQDPTWDYNRWGGYGSFWYEHVYMPAQNPGDPTGWSAYGRWFYGPWFWPPYDPPHGPILNPYYNMDPATGFTTPLAVPCNFDDPTTWQYQESPYCEPQYIPGTPNNSAGMEQFNDTPIVNGTAYPTITLDPKSYRFRILNAANDRFWNLQWYIADPSTGTESEVALDPALVAAAQLDPVVFPTPLKSMIWNGLTYDLRGPDWIQIASEGGFLPAPVVIDGQQETTWITDPTRFDVGNVDLHSLVVAPAERADVIVDFSQFAGKTLIMYNDAPAAYPARVPSYDYYTGYPDQYPNGPSVILPGYGPNTRTIMQVKINNIAPAPTFNLNALYNAFSHKANGTGVFESGQNPIIVGQAAYNSAYGTNFASTSWCNAPGAPINRCDGFARISDQGGTELGFNTLLSPNTRVTVPIQPKALHDETNAVAFDEFGRMTANIGVEAVPATPAAQNVTLFPYVNPATEFIDGTNLPHADIRVTPISNMADGTQIWKITHNGVDTHPIHFHLYDVQVLNRVTWDNIILRPEPNELGWKDTIRVSPLEDTIVALRAVIPVVPFEVPNSIRMLSPMMPAGSTTMFNNFDMNGNPTTPIVNQLVNFGWEYVWHCHILAHEEMDMMRPQSLVLPPNQPDGLAWSVSNRGNNTTLDLTWNDNSINETSFLVQKSLDAGVSWIDVGTSPSPLDQPNTHGTRSFQDTNFSWKDPTNLYRVVAQNTAGYGLEFPTMTAKSISAVVAVIQPPSNLIASLRAGPTIALNWMDNTTNETGFIVERSADNGPFVQIATAPASPNTGTVTFTDSAVVLGSTYTYRVAAVTAVGVSPYSNLATVTVDVPLAPSNVLASAIRRGSNERITLTWVDNSNNESGFQIQYATDSAFTNPVTINIASNLTTYTTGNVPLLPYYLRIQAVNVLGASGWVNATPFPLPPPVVLGFRMVR